MKTFKNKEQVLEYIKKIGKGKVILIRGSTATKPLKNFSDIDIEVYSDKLKKAYYEIVLVNKKIVLITIYYYKYEKGREIKASKNVKIISGGYNEGIEKSFNSPGHFAKDKYNHQEKIKRECQMVTDFMFKYLRTKNKEYLKSVQKRI
ncbi:MAG TPA: nucleotidyltransferase domain-containing protein [Candidatus Nanoarchaeia archaeon]|nr:nucleotidyltransferase domain-containing protein [Candidatus Nanoarchaeia archaeon]